MILWYQILFLIEAVWFVAVIRRGRPELCLVDVYVGGFIVSLVLARPDTIVQCFYILAWLPAFVLGAKIYGRGRIPIFRRTPIQLIDAVLLAGTVYVGVRSVGALGGFSLAAYDSERAEVRLDYFSYMIAKGIFLYVVLVLVFGARSTAVRISGVGLGLVVAIASLQKSPLVFVVLAPLIFIGVARVRRGGGTGAGGIRRLTLMAGGVLASGVGVSSLIYGSGWLITTQSVFRRVFLLPGDLAISAMNMVTERKFIGLGGASFSSVYEGIGLPSIHLGEETYAFVYGGLPEGASANTPALVSLYADFRLVGLLGAVLLGAVFKMIDWRVLSVLRTGSTERSLRRKVVRLRAAYATAILMTFKLNITAFGTAILSEGLGLMLVLTCLALADLRTAVERRGVSTASVTRGVQAVGPAGRRGDI